VAKSALIFNVVERAEPPTAPVSPNRALIAVLSLAAGVVLGVGTVLVRSCFDRSFRDVDSAGAALGVPVLGSIPKIETLMEREAAKRKQRVAALAVLVLLVAAGGAVFAQMSYDNEISQLVRQTLGGSR
jgi:uncharacterized protein involved in exopolysaccharide biosynthesis